VGGCIGVADGIALPFPAACIDHDFGYVKHHPVREAYQLYEPTPHERPTWDLTSALWAVRPERGYFELSNPGAVVVDDKGVTTFEESVGGRHRYLVLPEGQRERNRETLALLVSTACAVISAKATCVQHVQEAVHVVTTASSEAPAMTS